ncbi:MAG: hypothetical protein ACLRSW_03565 [Christensenellaceae bacterium]
MPNAFSYIAINFVAAMRNAIMAAWVSCSWTCRLRPDQLGRHHQRRSDKGLMN